MASVEEVKANVAASVDGAGRAATGIQQVTDQLDDVLVLLRMTAIGSFHPSVADAIAQLEQARTRLDEAHQLTRAAMDAANTFRTVI
jgi:ATP-dependent protease HslVU (ClpYQ) peptidase subunit